MDGDGFGKTLNAFFTQREGDDLHSLKKSSEPEGLICAKMDLKLNFRFTEFLDCKNFHRDANIQARLAEQVFVQNNTLWTGLGFTPHQLVLGLTSGVPGIYDAKKRQHQLLSGLKQDQGSHKQKPGSTNTAPPDPRGQLPIQAR